MGIFEFPDSIFSGWYICVIPIYELGETITQRKNSQINRKHIIGEFWDLFDTYDCNESILGLWGTCVGMEMASAWSAGHLLYLLYSSKSNAEDTGSQKTDTMIH